MGKGAVSPGPAMGTRLPALEPEPRGMGAALTKRSRAGAGAAGNWPIPGG